MPPFGPVKRKGLIESLRRLGFSGPFAGGKHQYLVRESHRVRIPNPHQGDISKGLLMRILREAEVSRDEWENA